MEGPINLEPRLMPRLARQLEFQATQGNILLDHINTSSAMNFTMYSYRAQSALLSLGGKVHSTACVDVVKLSIRLIGLTLRLPDKPGHQPRL